MSSTFTYEDAAAPAKSFSFEEANTPESKLPTSEELNYGVDLMRRQQAAGDPNANTTDTLSAIVNDPLAIPRALNDKVVAPAEDAISYPLRSLVDTWSRMTGVGPPLLSPEYAHDSLIPKDVLDDLKNENHGPVIEGITGAIAKGVGVLTTAQSFSTLPLFEFKAGRAAILASMAAATPSQIADTYQVLKDPKSTPEQKWESLGDSGIQLAMTAGLALGMKPADVMKLTPEEAASRAQSLTAFTDQALADTREKLTLKVDNKPFSFEEASQPATPIETNETAPIQPVEAQDTAAPQQIGQEVRPDAQAVDETSQVEPQPTVDQSVKSPEIKSFNRTAYGKAMDIAENPKSTQAKRDAALETMAQLESTFPNIKEAVIAQRAANSSAKRLANSKRFNSESDDDILGWIKDNGKLISKTDAGKKGRDWWAQNGSQYEGLVTLSSPNHNAIYDKGGSTPNVVAQAAFEAGKLKEPTADALWKAIDIASKRRSGKSAQFSYEEAALKNEIAAHDEHMKNLSEDDPGIYDEDVSAEFLPPEERAAPQLAPGENQGDLISSTQKEDFALTGESEAEAARIQAEKEQAAKDKAKSDENQTGFIGMGGAIPSEFEGEHSFVSNMFAAIDKEREAMGKPPMPETKARSWDADNTTALNRMNREPDWIPKLIDEVKKSPRPLLSWENAGMVWQRAKWKAEATNALTRIATAFDDRRESDLQQARLDNAYFEDKLNELDEVVGRNGTGSEAGRSLQAQKMAADDDFSLVEMRLQKRAANGGNTLTDAQSKEISDLHARLEETQQAFEKHKADQQQKISQMEADAALNRIKAEASKEAIHPAIIEQARKIVAKLDTRADAARARLKERLSRASAGVDPTILADLAEIGASHLGHAVVDVAEWSAKMVSEFGDFIKPHLKEIYDASEKLVKNSTKDNLEAAREMRNKSPEDQIKANAAKIGEKVAAGKKGDTTWYVQRIARLMVENGVTDREKLIDSVHEVLQEHLPDITRRETMDAISGYGDFKQLTKDQISIQLRGMKGEMQQLAKLEDMAKGEPPLKSGVERRTPTEAERQLIKKVQEAKYAFQVPMTDPATQLKSALDTYKTSLRNRTADLQDRIDRGDYARGPRRELQLDNEAMRLKAENERVKQKFQQGLNRDKMKQRTPWEKTMDTLVKWRRGFILSGPVTLAKLTSAAIARGLITPVEEAVGAGVGHLLPSLAERAPRESGFNTRAEVKAITEGFTNGMKDAWDILRTGKSSLDLVHKKDSGLPQSFIDIFGNVHGALKAPVKRAEFARSFQKRAEFYAKQGIDITDEFVQTRIGLEAYKDAERSIFMQKNWLVNKVNSALKADIDSKTGHASNAQKSLEAAAGVLMPIRRVPTNIVAETMQYAIGTVTGSVRYAKAFRNGIETLPLDEGDLIMRELKKGLLGNAIMLTAFFCPKILGGFYQQGEKRDKKDIPPDAARIDGIDIPPSVIHNPWIGAGQIATTIRRVSDSKLRKKDMQTQGLSHGAMAGAVGLADSTPFIRESLEIGKLMNPYERDKWLGEMAKSMVIPQGIQSIAQYLDKDAKGETVKRDPKTTLQTIETGIPGLRKNVPIKRK